MKKLFLLISVLSVSIIALVSCVRRPDETYAIRKAARDTEISFQIDDYKEEISRNIILPKKSLAIDISWKSSNEQVISNEGVVKLPNETTNVELTATLKHEPSKTEKQKTFKLTVLSKENANKKIKSLIESYSNLYITSNFEDKYLDISKKLSTQLPNEKDKPYVLGIIEKVQNLKLAQEKEAILLDTLNKENYESFKALVEKLGDFYSYDKKLFNEKELVVYNKLNETVANPTTDKLEELNKAIETINTSLYYQSFKKAYDNFKLAFESISKNDLTLEVLEKVALLKYNYLNNEKQAELKNNLKTNAQRLFTSDQASYKELIKNLLKKDSFVLENKNLIEILNENITDSKEKEQNTLNLLAIAYSKGFITLEELKNNTIQNQEVKALHAKYIKKAQAYEDLKSKVKQIDELVYDKEDFTNVDVEKFNKLFQELKTVYEGLDLNQEKLFENDLLTKEEVIVSKKYKDFSNYYDLKLKLDNIEKVINIEKLAETAKEENVKKIQKQVLANLKNERDKLEKDYNNKLNETNLKIKENNSEVAKLKNEKKEKNLEINKLEKENSNETNSNKINQNNEKIADNKSRLDSINNIINDKINENKKLRDELATFEKNLDIANDKLTDYVLILANELIKPFSEALKEINELKPTENNNLLKYYENLITNKYMTISLNLLNNYKTNQNLNTYVGKAQVNKVVDTLLNFTKTNSFDKELVVSKNKDINFSIRKVTIAKTILSVIFIILGLLIFFVLQSISVEYAEKKGYEELRYKLLASIPLIGLLIIGRLKPRRNVRRGILYRAIKPTELFAKIIIYLELILLAIIVIIPIIYMIGLSLQKNATSIPLELWPRRPSFDTYKSLFVETEFPKWYGNTLLIAIVNMVFGTVIITGASYVFARFNFRGKKAGLLTLLALQSFPTFMGLIAMYVLFNFFGLTGKPLALSILYIGGSIPGNIWLIKGFMDNIPKDLDESAAIDGANKLKIFFRIIFPLSVPILTFVALGMFMSPWMDYMLPSYLLNELPKNAAAGARVEDQWTVAVGLFKFINDPQKLNYAAFAAGALVVGIPITVLYTSFQRYLIEGIMAGATKG